MTDSELRGPIFMVHLDRDEPWISSIVEAGKFNRAALTTTTPQVFKRCSAGDSNAEGTPLFWDELMWLEDGQMMLEMFFAGSVSRRNRQCIPEWIEAARDFSDDEETRAYIEDREAELRDLSS